MVFGRACDSCIATADRLSSCDFPRHDLCAEGRARLSRGDFLAAGFPDVVFVAGCCFLCLGGSVAESCGGCMLAKLCRELKLACARDTVAFTYAVLRRRSESVEKNRVKLSNSEVNWMFRLRRRACVPDDVSSTAEDLDLLFSENEDGRPLFLLDDLPPPASRSVKDFLEGRTTSADRNGETVTRGFSEKSFDNFPVEDLEAT